MDIRASKRQQLHARGNQPHDETICNQRRPQEPQCNATESNQRDQQQEARAARRGASSDECADEREVRPATAGHPQKKASPLQLVVLRRCEDLQIRTSGFQKIKEDSQRRPIDLRRQHKQQQIS